MEPKNAAALLNLYAAMYLLTCIATLGACALMIGQLGALQLTTR